MTGDLTTLPLDQEVTASVERNLACLEPAFPRFQAMIDEIEGLLRDEAPLSLKIERLEAMYKFVESLLAPVSACRHGCHHCCMMAVGCSSRDAQRIAEYLGIQAHPPEQSWVEQARSVLVERYLRVPCPFLKEGQCSVYPVRPAACRTHFNLSDYSALCDLFLGTSDVPTLDLRILWLFESMVALEAGWLIGDIRDFFPDVSGGVQNVKIDLDKR